MIDPWDIMWGFTVVMGTIGFAMLAFEKIVHKERP